MPRPPTRISLGPTRSPIRLALAASLAALVGCGQAGSPSGTGVPGALTYRPSYSFRPPPSVAPRFMAQRVTWSPEGSEIAVSDPRCEGVRIFGSDGKHLGILGGDAPRFARLEAPMGVAYSPDGMSIAVTDMANHRVSLFNRSGAFIALLNANGNDADPAIREPWDVAYSPNGEIIALSNGRLYDRTGRFLRSLPVGGVGVSFFAEGQTLAFVSAVGTPRITVVDLAGTTIRSFGTPMGAGQESLAGLIHHPMGISCSPDGKLVAVTDERQSRLLFYSARGVHLSSFDGKDGKGPDEFGYPRGIAFSPDGSKLAICDVNNERVLVFASSNR